MTEDTGFRPFRLTAAGDAYDSGTAGGSRITFLVKAKLVAGAAAATATLTDANGTVLAELSAPANGADWLDIPVIAEGKVRVNALAGAGAVVMVYVN